MWSFWWPVPQALVPLELALPGMGQAPKALVMVFKGFTDSFLLGASVTSGQAKACNAKGHGFRSFESVYFSLCPSKMRMSSVTVATKGYLRSRLLGL